MRTNFIFSNINVMKIYSSLYTFQDKKNKERVFEASDRVVNCGASSLNYG